MGLFFKGLRSHKIGGQDNKARFSRNFFLPEKKSVQR